jgi:hypothetical protein
VVSHEPDDYVDRGVDGCRDRSRQLVTEAVIVTFDADDDESPGQPAERTAEGRCLTDPERVGADAAW